MDSLAISILIFVVSLAVLIKASDFFTDAAEKVGLIVGLPPFIIGVTIVAIGTSIPELVSSLVAVSQNSSEIVIGNVIGSNVANIFLIVGVASIISTQSLLINYDLVSVDLPLFIGSSFLLSLIVWDLKFSLYEGILLIVGYIFYIFYAIDNGKEANVDEEEIEEIEKDSLVKDIAILVVSSVFIFFGATYTIQSISSISSIVGIGKEVIAISAVAIGTSLPELLVTISAARKGKPEMAVGNVLGSNIFNSFLVMGIPRLFGRFTMPTEVIQLGIPVMVCASLLLFFVTQDKKVTQWEGWLFIIFYAWFVSQFLEFL